MYTGVYSIRRNPYKEAMPHKPPYKVVLAEDHEIVRVGLSLLIEQWEDFEVIAEATNGKEAIAHAGMHRPDLVLMDVGMPVLDGVQATQEIRKRYNDTKVVMLTSHSDSDTVFASLASGAQGYCIKDVTPEKLRAGLTCVLFGDLWVDAILAQHLLSFISSVNAQGYGSADELVSSLNASANASRAQAEKAAGSVQTDERPNLTGRQLEILALIVDGKSNAEIADDLSISRDTVKTHVRHILERLAITDRTQAAVKAIKEGYFDD